MHRIYKNPHLKTEWWVGSESEISKYSTFFTQIFEKSSAQALMKNVFYLLKNLRSGLVPLYEEAFYFLFFFVSPFNTSFPSHRSFTVEAFTTVRRERESERKREKIRIERD